MRSYDFFFYAMHLFFRVQLRKEQKIFCFIIGGKGINKQERKFQSTKRKRKREIENANGRKRNKQETKRKRKRNCVFLVHCLPSFFVRSCFDYFYLQSFLCFVLSFSFVYSFTGTNNLSFTFVCLVRSLSFTFVFLQSDRLQTFQNKTKHLSCIGAIRSLCFLSLFLCFLSFLLHLAPFIICFLFFFFVSLFSFFPLKYFIICFFEFNSLKTKFDLTRIQFNY